MNNRLYIFIGIGIGAVLLLMVISSLTLPKQKPAPTTRVGQIITPTGFQNKNATTNNQQSYSVSSSLITRSNTVITDSSNKVIFKRTVFLAPSVTLPRFADYTKQYGQPDKQVTGSKYYGATMITKIYAAKGLTIIGNPNTDEVYEAQEYSPTTVDTYIQNYGEDIDEGTKPHEAL